MCSLLQVDFVDLCRDSAMSESELSPLLSLLPRFLMVLTGIGQYAYRRPEDGVLVVPIGCLKP